MLLRDLPWCKASKRIRVEQNFTVNICRPGIGIVYASSRQYGKTKLGSFEFLHSHRPAIGIVQEICQ